MSEPSHETPPKGRWWQATLPLDYRLVGFLIMGGSLLSFPLGYFTHKLRPWDNPPWLELAYFLTLAGSFFLLWLWTILFHRKQPPLPFLCLLLYIAIFVTFVFIPPS